MPVPASISDLSTTPSLNSPAGSESPALLDDYIRTHAAFIRTVSDSDALKAADSAVVKLTGDQTVAGIKTFTGNVVLGGTGQRITGDFSNATAANRVMFQTSTVNSGTNISIIPNGTVPAGSGTANLRLEDSSSIATGNGSFGSVLLAQDTDFRIQSNRIGTGTYLPMTFYTGGSERMRIGTSGQIGLGGENYGTSGQALVSNGSGAAPSWQTISSGLTAASTAEAQAGTIDTKAITPLKLREGLNASGSAPIYACRAWVNFNGTGTVAIRASGNVSSITDNGVGDYTVNLTTAMPDANYGFNITGTLASGAIGSLNSATTPTSSALRVQFVGTSGAATDPLYASVAIFR